MAETRATGKKRFGNVHSDSLEIRANVARLIAFCRGVATNDQYASITFEDRAAEALAAIEDRLSKIASLKSTVPSALGKISEIQDLADLTLPDATFPDFYGISSAIPDISDALAELGDLGLDLDSPLSSYDMLEAPEGFGDTDLVFSDFDNEALGSPLDTASASSALESEAGLTELQEDLDVTEFGGSSISNMFSEAQEDL